MQGLVTVLTIHYTSILLLALYSPIARWISKISSVDNFYDVRLVDILTIASNISIVVFASVYITNRFIKTMNRKFVVVDILASLRKRVTELEEKSNVYMSSESGPEARRIVSQKILSILKSTSFEIAATEKMKIVDDQQILDIKEKFFTLRGNLTGGNFNPNNANPSDEESQEIIKSMLSLSECIDRARIKQFE